MSTVPQNVIAIWTGLLSNIPSGWALCDGNSGRPNLLDRFVRGNPVGGTLGATGGNSTHLHTIGSGGSHDHGDSGSDGAHQHTTPTTTGSHTHGSTQIMYETGVPMSYVATDHSAGDHNHTWNSEGSHIHYVQQAGSHSHTCDSATLLPSYYEVAFIISDGTPTTFASGIILYWSQTLASIPTNWNLCDGNSGRPNLLGKFLKGVPNGSTNPGSTGGADTHNQTMQSAGSHSHTLWETGSHTHTSNSAGDHTHDVHPMFFLESGNTVLNESSGGDHTHGSGSGGQHSHTTTSGGSHTHTLQSSVDHRPPYYEVAPIYSSGATINTVGLIAMYVAGTTPPNGWQTCDGSSPTPDLRGKFLRGVPNGSTNPGNTGGNATHTHTLSGAAWHGHTCNQSAGAHTHSCNDTSWSHYHGGMNRGGAAYTIDVQPMAFVGSSHNHGTLSSTGSHTSHAVYDTDSPADHSVSSIDNLPPCMNVLFIYRVASIVTKTFSIDGYLKRIAPKSFTIDAILLQAKSKIFSIDGILETAQSILIDPIDSESKLSPMYLRFKSSGKTSPDKKHFEIQVDKTSNAFGDLEINPFSRSGVSNWEFWNGSSWTALPVSGLDPAYYGNEVRFYTALTTGHKWWRVFEEWIDW